MKIYNSLAAVPDQAKKTIGGGRLKGFTDINPMWRIEKLTETYGPVGIGWYTEVTRQWLEKGTETEVVAFCNINLYVKDGDKWSAPIFGNGGSSFITMEKAGVYTSDEAYKMAYTDAISVACKALGMGANVYWEKGDRTKYSRHDDNTGGDTTPHPDGKATNHPGAQTAPPAGAKPATTPPATSRPTGKKPIWEYKPFDDQKYPVSYMTDALFNEVYNMSAEDIRKVMKNWSLDNWPGEKKLNLKKDHRAALEERLKELEGGASASPGEDPDADYPDQTQDDLPF